MFTISKGIPMSEAEIVLTKQDQLALAIARGNSVAAWARHNDVPRSTAFRWAKEQGVRRLVSDCRRRALDRALGRMASHSGWAVKAIIQLAGTSKSDSVKLTALRALLRDQMEVSQHTELEYRMCEIE